MKIACFLITTGIALLLVMSPLSHAGAGRTAAQFLTLGEGPRADSMGNAFATMSGDIMCLFSNPGGLADMEELQGAYSYKDYGVIFDEAGEGLYYSLLAGGGPVDLGLLDLPLGVIGAGLQINGQGTIDITADSPEVIRQEDLGTNWALTASYADRYTHRLSKTRTMGLSGGLSGKVIRQVLGPVSSTAYALDLGVLFDALNIYMSETTTKLNEPTFRLRAGTVLQNLGTRIQFKDEHQSDPLPRMLKFGALAGANLRARELFPAEQSIPMNLSLLRVNVAGEFTAFIDKLREDDEEGLEEFVEQQYKENNPANKTKEQIRADIEAKRGVGINAFRYGNMSKSIGLELWMLEVLALRLGYKNDPFMSFVDTGDKISFGLGLRLPVSILLEFVMRKSPEPNLFDKLYRQSDRQMFLQLDFASVPGGGPRNKRLTTFALSGGF